jgi:hypothetical protein
MLIKTTPDFPYGTAIVQINKTTGEQTFSIGPRNEKQRPGITDTVELKTYQVDFSTAYSYDSHTEKYYGHVFTNGRIEKHSGCVGWNAKNTEKPETLSHVPDKLWNAFIDTEGVSNLDAPTSFSTMFLLPKWDIHLTETPPSLNKVEPTEERMLTYDYLSIIDKDIERKIRDGITPDDKESLDLLYRLRENIAGVLDYPLTENSEDVSNYRFHIAFSQSENSLTNIYVAKTIEYQLNLLDKATDQSMVDHNIPEEYKPQLTERLNQDEELLSAGKEFLGNLLNANSNIDVTEITPNISDEWYTTFLAEHIGKVLDEMGTPGTPDGEWEIPVLWKIKQQKAAQA